MCNDPLESIPIKVLMAPYTQPVQSAPVLDEAGQYWTEDRWDSVIDVSLKGSFLYAKFAANRMIEQSYGKIVNILSRAPLGGPGQANYSAAKARIVELEKSMAKELGRHNIHVNCIAPGLILHDRAYNIPNWKKLLICLWRNPRSKGSEILLG